MSGRRANQTRAAKKRRYLALRTEQGVSQAEAIRLLNVGRTTAWAWDREAGIANEPKAEPNAGGHTPSKPEDAGEIRDHVARLEKQGVIPAGVIDHETTGLPELVILDGVDSSVLRRGSLLFFQGERGTQPVGELGERVDEDDVFPIPTSGRPHSPVRVHVGRESPSSVQKFARMESHR